jgi:hypothetical protein
VRITAQAIGPLAISEISAAAARVARGVTAEPVLPPEFQSEKVSVEKTYAISLSPTAAARGLATDLTREAELPVIAIEAEAAENEAPLVVLRHSSGAITFHPGIAAAGRRGAAGGSRYQFRIALRRAHTTEGRRGLIAETVKAAVLKVTRPVIDRGASFMLSKLAELWERAAWKRRNLVEGWFRVIPPGAGGSLGLQPAKPEPGKRNLLLIHGTFSNAASAFGALTKTDFFTRVVALYENRIYAFNHFTVSKSPQMNVEQLLSELPEGKCLFDVITHSRGGLVLRTIVERGADFGQKSARFQLGRAVLVASPNDGTPLATPDRWDKTVGWIANLMKLVERLGLENPFLTGAEFVAEGLVWLAHHVAGDLPGLRAMDGAGETIEELQGPPAPPLNAYSSLVSNYQPDEGVLQMMIDAGIDQFFGSANDLVVPSEGGWRVDRDGVQHVEAASVGCFGPGGNLASGDPAAVMHTSFFHRPETATFLARALSGESQALPSVNLDAPLPDRRFTRGAVAAAARASGVQRAAPGRLPATTEGIPFMPPTTSARDTFHIVIIEVPSLDGEGQATDAPTKKPREQKRRALIYAAYGGARVVEEFPLGGGAAGQRWHKIIGIHEKIKKATDGRQGPMPTSREMASLGRLLFSVLFTGDVKRLYDTARSLQGNRRLDLVFTSMVPWVAEKPWEFAFDPGRQTHLATEEIHFIRNVLTQVPGDASEARPGPLRILVVSAQPAGSVELSIAQETELIQRDFAALTNAGLARVEILPRATISDLHSKLSTAQFNVVHFIGHGVFDTTTKQGYLLFQTQAGAQSMLDQRSARELLCGRGVQLLFLNACQTGSSSHSDFNSGLAQDLVAHGLPALVANQYSVLDTAATSFAQFFYWGLARGLTLGAAAREARIAVNYALNGQTVIDWAVPVLYARDPNTFLTTSAPPVPFVKPMAAAAEAPRTGAGRALQIAVWDVDRALPRLEDILARMNAAQSRIELKAANLSAPLDAFKAENGVRYLWKERVARRLSGSAGQLGANVLLCLTHYPLNQDSDGRVYAWWPKSLESPVLVFSYAGMKLDPDSTETARALANTIVRAIAAIKQGLALHDRGPRTCPMFENRQADLATIMARQEFDPQCRNQFKEAPYLADLDALLRVFDQPAEQAATERPARRPKKRAGRRKMTT